ncbi:amidohydrolase family protein [Verticillium alfalfae VaMs.102]|uniref:Amidohydrolase family protein n=1 Tax=Verticillium alfalfae (strain VaMs.102 / ATCC MYA-4576 / FGSC 10136) TaxID=526221 RepID=C9SEK1_VERA1|nr:amidohydrolase family protein [Verticillium alfalfae VaMs.102]EEY16594.1 amidohydrolase family protein [Verticillium alfalfae VaMs.102]
MSVDNPPSALFVNGRILARSSPGLTGEPVFADSMLVQDGLIRAIGTREESLRKVSLDHCKSFEDIRIAIKTYAEANPEVPRILCKGWMHSMTPEGTDASMLDDIDPRPIFIDTKDLHSTWCNSAGLEELGVANMPDPAGGTIHRDANGKPNGVLSEGAVLSIVWPHQAKVSPMAERQEAILAAVETYNASGYTGLVEMAMDEPAWDALVALRAAKPDLPMRIAAYWLIKPSDDAEARHAQVRRAIELHSQLNASTSPDLRIAGIKIVCDGIIDACTVYLSEPYAPADSPPPIWAQDDLEPIVAQADAAGLQIALHAIGDGAIKMAVDVLEKHTTPGRRHRIEHLELASPEDAKRLGDLNLTASIQPVHADPAILRAWPRLIGSERCKRAFAYREMADAGALMALGSDSPTAPWAPLQNVYVASTRRSAREPEYEVTGERELPTVRGDRGWYKGARPVCSLRRGPEAWRWERWPILSLLTWSGRLRAY